MRVPVMPLEGHQHTRPSALCGYTMGTGRVAHFLTDCFFFSKQFSPLCVAGWFKHIRCLAS